MARFVKSGDKKRTATLKYVTPKQRLGMAAAATRKERGLARAASRAAGRTAAQEADKAPAAKLSRRYAQDDKQPKLMRHAAPAKKKGMSLNKAIKGMQRTKPWN